MAYLYGNFAMPQPDYNTMLLQQQQQQQQQCFYHQQSSTDASFYEDMARQLAAAAAASNNNSSSNASTMIQRRRRLSRSSQQQQQQQHQRTTTPAMRVVKPCSANNSPTSVSSSSSSSLSQLRKRMPAAAGASGASGAGSMATGRPPRPVSWHPSSSNYLMPAFVQQPYYNYHPSNYTTSTQTSPSTDFSPYLAATPYDASLDSFEALDMQQQPQQHQQHQQQQHHQQQPQFYSPNPWAALSPTAVPVASNAAAPLLFDPLPSPDMQHMYQPVQQPQAVPSSTTTTTEYAYAICAPRTPPMYSPSSNEPAAVPVEVAVATADEADASDAEILVGLGLYDRPDDSNTYNNKGSLDDDVTLQSYRSSVAQLLGAAYESSSEGRVPVGRGLKLEDAWEPPENMDDEEEEEEEEEDDDERDAEGEDL